MRYKSGPTGRFFASSSVIGQTIGQALIPGILLAPETHILFVGVGERILAYDLKRPRRLWEDGADTSFHRWQRHGETIVMSAELELAAWDIQGNKRWTTFVEPPWDFEVEGDMVHLDVMGTISTFSLHTGPIRS